MPREFYLPSGLIGPIGPDPRLENKVIGKPDSGGNKNCRHQIFFKIQVSTLVKLSRFFYLGQLELHVFFMKSFLVDSSVLVQTANTFFLNKDR